MKKYALGTLACCLMMVGMNLPGHGAEEEACVNISKKDCESWSVEQWNDHCHRRHRGDYIRHSWTIGACGTQNYPGQGACVYVCSKK